MSEFIIYIIFIALWNVILFYGKSFGISVILFMIPLVYLIYKYFKKNNLIMNKKGLLFIIPILLLSLSYFIFDSYLFNILNVPVIIVLLLLMYIYTIKPTDRLSQIVIDSCFLLFEPIGYIGKFGEVIKNKLFNNSNLSEKTKKNIISILIVIPVALIIIVLLAHADIIFKELFRGIIDILKSISIFDGIIGKTMLFIFILFVLGSTLMNISEKYLDYSRNEKKFINKDSNTIKLLIIVLDIIYVVFDYIQIKSLMLHSVSSGIDYATYARQGFFELLVVSIINISIILLSKKFKNTSNKDTKIINISSVIMVLLTLIIIVSSFLRMNLYEEAYGYTMLRLLVYITLITETILLIPTVMYIFNPKVQIVKYYIIIIVSVYTLINFANLDYIIARRNVNRYYNSSMKVVSRNIDTYVSSDYYGTYYMTYEFTNLDLNYLCNNRTDNINILIELYNKTEDPYIVDYLNNYFDDLKLHYEMDWQEYNLSKRNARNKLINLKNRNPQF